MFNFGKGKHRAQELCKASVEGDISRMKICKKFDADPNKNVELSITNKKLDIHTDVSTEVPIIIHVIIHRPENIEEVVKTLLDFGLDPDISKILGNMKGIASLFPKDIEKILREEMSKNEKIMSEFHSF